MRAKSARELLDFSRRLQAATGFSDLVIEAQAEIHRHVGYNNAWMFVWEDESLETGRLLAIQGDREKDIWEHAPILKTSGDAMLEEIVHGQGVVVVADARTDPRTNKQMVAKLGNRSIVNVPLRLLDKPFGALGCGTFGDEGCRPPSPEEVDYLVQIAAHLSLAAGRIRLGQEREARAKERLKLERRLAQSQRLESLGVLAGGIAQDFGNVLSAMIEAVQLSKREPLSERQRADLDRALALGERAAERVEQLLSMGRQRELALQMADANAVIESFMGLSRHLLPVGIQLDFIAGEQLPNVNVDPGQLEQVFMNLLLNARAAMPDGGRLTLETEQVSIDGNDAQLHPWAKSGRYVLISVTDTGVGMTQEVLARVFEPLFTTKAEGAGTGLGLAVAYGIVRSHEGMLHCHSERGVGTTFKIYLPAYSRAVRSV
jgi:signal transduction histidine kinase